MQSSHARAWGPARLRTCAKPAQESMQSSHARAWGPARLRTCAKPAQESMQSSHARAWGPAWLRKCAKPTQDSMQSSHARAWGLAWFRTCTKPVQESKHRSPWGQRAPFTHLTSAASICCLTCGRCKKNLINRMNTTLTSKLKSGGHKRQQDTLYKPRYSYNAYTCVIFFWDIVLLSEIWK